MPVAQRVEERTGPRGLPELAFVMAPRQNLFFVELVEALRAEAELAGARTSLHVGNFPSPRRDLIYVLVPPHEYFTLMHGRIGPPPEALRRTIMICAEQPGTPFFQHNLDIAPRAGAIFDINRHAIRAFAEHDVQAAHLQLGWTPGWDREPAPERDIDIVFMGCISERRERALARYARIMWRHRSCLILSDNSLPNWRHTMSYWSEEHKWELLGRTKVLINVHQGESPYFEWLRIVQAMTSGVAVVSEHSVDCQPLAPGRHFLSGDVGSLGLMAELLLSDEQQRERLTTAAYRVLRDEVRLADGVKALLASAARLAAGAPLPDPEARFFTQPQPEPERIELFTQRPRRSLSAAAESDAAVVRRAVKDIKLELLNLRRQQTRIELALQTGTPPPPLRVVRSTRVHAAARPRVSILMALYNHQEYVVEALDSVLHSRERSWEIVIVDDGSSDGSQRAVLDWMMHNEDRAALLLNHPVNRGLARARNAALGWARGEFCFVLDADNAIFPHCLERLLAALDGDPQATFSYGMLQRFSRSATIGLLNIHPWEPARLREGNYIDAMALVRTTALRERFHGYSVDGRLHGWEDFDLWCRMAEAGLAGTLVPEIVARYRTTGHSMLSLTNISDAEAFSLLSERHPGLMAESAQPA
ncbi:MAG: hypothetical protein NVS1B9_08540 [Solirubrobacteraceae bacterium]